MSFPTDDILPMEPESDSSQSPELPCPLVVPPKEDPDCPPLLQLDTTFDSSVKPQEAEYYEDTYFISLNEQPDEKCQTYRLRFYSDDMSSLPILQILSRFQTENGKAPQKTVQ